MAILSNLLVNGESRLLGKLYTNDISIGNNVEIASKTTTAQLYVKTTMNNNTNYSVNSDNLPFVVGTITGRHIVMDSDEITAKNGATGASTLYLNYGGGQVNLSTNAKIVANDGTLTAPTISNTTLTSTTATITTGNITTANTNKINNADMITTSAMDVKGKLHAVEYDLENIMDLGGSFVVAPTLIVPSSGSGTKTLTVAKSNDTTVVLTVKDPSITSTGIAGFAWANNYKVKVSGLINNTVLGTCDGYINSTNVSSNTISLTVTMDSATVTAIATTVSNYKLNIMLYNTDTSSATAVTKPLGIYLQHYQLTNNPIINVWNGQTTTPKVRIGYLGGITYNNENLGTNAQNSWGLYSDNVFLEGQIVAKGGKIGGYSIGTSNLTKGTTQNASGSFWLTPEGQSSVMSNLSSSAQTWAMTVGQNFGVTTAGSLYAISGHIGGFDMNSEMLNSGTAGSSGSVFMARVWHNSVSIGGGTSDSWRIGAGTSFGVTNTGTVYANDIRASGGTIGGFKIDTTSIRTNDVAVTSNADNSISFSSADFTRTILSTSRAGLRFAIGDKFGVTGDGVLYTDGANITNLSASNITTGTLSAERIAVTDFTNYCQLNPNTATLYGWTLTQDSSNPNTPWYVRDTLGRDNYPSTWFDCKPGDIFKVSMTASSTVTGATTSGGAGGTYMSINLGVQCQTATGSSYWPTFTIVTSNAAGTETTKTGYVTIPTSAEYIKFRAFIQIGGVAPFAGTLKIRNPVIKRVGADEYITYVNSTDGIKIHNASDATNYLQMNSSAILFRKNDKETLKIDNNGIRIGEWGENLRNIYITNNVVQIRKYNTVLAEYGDGIKLYQPNGTEVVNISTSGATFKGSINATGGFIGENSTNGFNISSKSIWNGISTQNAASGTGIYLGTDGINLGGGKFNVTKTGFLTSTSGTIGGWTVSDKYLYTLNNSLYTTLKKDGDVAFAAGSPDYNSGIGANLIIGHDGSLKAGKMQDAYSAGSTYSLQVYSIGNIFNNSDMLVLNGSGSLGSFLSMSEYYEDEDLIVHELYTQISRTGGFESEGYDYTSDNNVYTHYTQIYNGIIKTDGINNQEGQNIYGRKVFNNPDAFYIYGNNAMITRIATQSHNNNNPGLGFMIGNGYYAAGSADNGVITDQNNSMYLVGGCDGSGYYLRSYPTYNRKYTASANMHITDMGTIGRATSSSVRYKHDVEYYTNKDNSTIDKSKILITKKKSKESPESILNIPIVTFKYNEGYVTGEADFDYEKPILGLIAEDVAKICPECATYIKDDDGNEIPEAWDEKAVLVRLLYVVQKQNEMIKELQKEVQK